ncbi:AfsR/SARP family transcriptional regulator [Actinomadura viridis]|uniref:ATPase/DNA-binding SARP family transcriptional activator n=1 Tax=Actinomadura viridis TaxID=58110 RepID=A0A931DR46_9ACTN|nr:BTAD domain-containing putative transcriptional regulator [Actinomadura viridis]MBG6091178.1 putative ATPase/DNA-binding SARP family transcriptional activator [Actinomadura viridis]
MRIRILGPLEAAVEGRPLEVGGARLRALLTLLALDAGRMLPAERIIDDLWEDRAPATAPNALQSLVSRLRSVIGRERVESRPGAYRLVVPREAVDAHEFEARVLAARRAAGPGARSAELRAALALWRGAALADTAGLPFAEGPAARLEGLRRAALDERIDADLELGRHAELIPELRAMAVAEPLREPLRARLIRALYGAGGQAEALAEYESVKGVLAEALGVSPSPELEALHLAVLRQDPALLPAAVPGPGRAGSRPFEDAADPSDPPDPSNPSNPSNPSDPSDSFGPSRPARRAGDGGDGVPGNLRARLTSFIGRDDDLERVRRILAEQRLLTLTGPGGAGKTRLSLEAAERQRDLMPDGVWVVELAPVTDPDEVPLAALAALGLRETMLVPAGYRRIVVAESADPLDRLAAALAGKRLLLVLDNCEHLLDAAARLADRVLAGCPGVRVLATSREPLGITGETLWPVGPLAPPPPDAGAAEAVTYDSVRLLADRAAAVSPGFAVTEDNVGPVVRICRALDGMPLATELAAVRLRAMTPEQMAARLGDRFRLLGRGSRTALPRHQTLRAVVGWSWDLLDEAEQALWRRLAVFAGGATVDAAERVCAGPELDPADVLDTLTALVDKSLVVVTEDGGPGQDGGNGGAGGARLPRYRMLETIRAYGMECLVDAGEEERVRRAHAEYFAELAQTAEPRLFRHDQLFWVGRLRAEHDNLHAGLRWAMAAGDAPLAARFCSALGWYWFLRGASSEVAEYYREVLAMPGLPEDHTTASAFALGILHVFDGPWTNSESGGWAQRARAICDAIDGEPSHPVLRMMLGTIELYLGGWNERAQELVRPLLDDPDPWVRGIAHFAHGQIAVNFGRVKEVDEDFALAMNAFREAGDRWGLAFALTAQAEVLVWRGEHRRSAGLYEEALRISAPLGNGQGMFIHTRALLAHALFLDGERDRAVRTLDSAFRDAERLAAKEITVMLEHLYAEFARHAGDVAEAARRLGRAERLSADLHLPPQFRAMVTVSRAHLEIPEGDPETIRRSLDEALASVLPLLDRPSMAQILVAHADLARYEGDPERAALLLGAARNLRGITDLSRPEAAEIEEAARRALGDGAFEAAYRRGRAKTFDDVLADFGLERPEAPTPGPAAGP